MIHVAATESVFPVVHHALFPQPNLAQHWHVANEFIELVASESHEAHTEDVLGLGG